MNLPLEGPAGPRFLRTFLQRAREHPQKTAFLFKKEGKWQSMTWQDYAEKILRLSQGLIRSGLSKGDKVAIFSENRLEWLISDLAILLAGGVVTAIYPKSGTEESHFIVNHSEAKFLIVDRKKRLEEFLKKPPPPTLKGMIVMEGDSFASLLRSEPIANPEDSVGALREDDLMTIIYTSGTTGRPKGALLTYRNVWSYLEIALYHVGDSLKGANHVAFSIVPLAHAFERLCGYYNCITCDTLYAIPEDLQHLLEDFRAVRPGRVNVVPYLLEKIREGILKKIDEKPLLLRRLALWALFHGKLKKLFGGKVRFLLSGGAPLSEEVARFFWKGGVPVLEGYGMTESALSGTISPVWEARIGSCGRPRPGTLRIAPDGEILLKGDFLFREYYKDPEATREAFDPEGWFKTGDLGRLDEEGYLWIVGRKKELIVTSSGKKVSPQKLEYLLRQIPSVSMAFVYGDNRKYITALLTLRPGAAGKEEILREIEEINRDLSPYEQIRDFRILPQDFSIESGELNQTLKFKRSVIVERHKELIEEMYTKTSPTIF